MTAPSAPPRRRFPLPTVTAADLAAARAEGRALAAFTVRDLQGVLAVRDAAEATGLPVLACVDPALFARTDRATLLGVVRAAVAGSPSRVGVHLGPCGELDEVAACLELGCSSVTFDASALPFAENADRTAAAVALGRRTGAWVAGTLGGHERGPGDGGHEPGPGSTDPARAAEFAERTGADVLAVRIGGLGAAGGRRGLDRLAAVAERVPVPLALHGLSGLGDALLRSVIARGAALVGVDADLRRAALAACAAVLPAAREDGEDLQRVLDAVRAAVAAVAADRARLFGLPGPGA